MTAETLTLAIARARRIDPVVLAMAAALLAVALFLPAQARESLVFTAESLVGIAPFLLLGVLVAAYTQAARVDALLARTFSGRTVVMIAAASLFGALSPFCSCGVIPLISALLAMGMPLPAVMAFWLSSPVMDPEVFVLTAGGLGLEFAVAKTLAAALLGLGGGLGMLALMRLGTFDAPLKHAAGCCAVGSLKNPKPVRWAFWHEPDRRAAFGRSVGQNAWFLGKWLTLAFFLESLMLAYLPPELVGRWVGGDNAYAIPLGALVGAPAYLNSYAAIPTTAALMDLGMTPGAALSFMTAGAVTSIPAAVAVFALVRLPVFLAYVAFGFTGALLAGLGYAAYAG